MTAEAVPEEVRHHQHMDIKPEDREIASRIGSMLGRSAVESNIRQLNSQIDMALHDGADPDGVIITSLRYQLEVWHQSGIVADAVPHHFDLAGPAD